MPDEPMVETIWGPMPEKSFERILRLIFEEPATPHDAAQGMRADGSPGAAAQSQADVSGGQTA